METVGHGPFGAWPTGRNDGAVVRRANLTAKNATWANTTPRAGQRAQAGTGVAWWRKATGQAIGTTKKSSAGDGRGNNHQ